jgi:hypothetical protein
MVRALLGLAAAAAITGDATPAGKVGGDCALEGKKLYGKVQVVEHFADFDVKRVDHFPDLRVQFVDNFPDACGRWQIVEHFPDFTIRYVDHFPDLEIERVDHFPGVP